MFYNSKFVASLLATSTAGTTLAFLTLVDDTPMAALVVATLISFSVTFLLSFFVLEFMFFRELYQINSKLNKLKGHKRPKEEVSRMLSELKEEQSANPIRLIDQEIMEFAEKKEAEIEQLRRMEAFRREFLANVSHELKTPIFATQGYLLTLLDGAIDDDTVRVSFLQKAAKALSGLDHLVQDLLTISKIESGEISMRYETFDIQTLMVDILDQFEHKAEKRQVRLLFEAPHEDEINVRADYNRLSQVMLNLVGNAIKYHKPEGGWVKVQLEEVNQSVRVIIADNGLGIPEEDQTRIFERFYRVEKSRVKSQGGSGLGLAIVKHILEEHHTQIRLKSKLGEGSAFSFELQKEQEPLHEASEF